MAPMGMIDGLRRRVASVLGGRGYRSYRQTREHNCVQTVVAIALSCDIAEVEREAGTSETMTVAETFDLLDRYGISCQPMSAHLMADFWPSVYERSGGGRLRGLAFRLPSGKEGIGHAYYIHGRRVYDPASGREVPLDPAVLRSLDWIAVLPDESF